MKGWHPMNALNSIETNKVIVEEFLVNNKFNLWEPQYGTTDRNHKISTVSIDIAIDFLTKFKFGNYADTARKQATIRYLQYLSTEISNPISNVHFIQMAYESNFRERSFDTSTFKIKQHFSGRDARGKDVYPGDNEIKSEDTICIQIHKIKLKCDQTNKLVNKIIYTIAIYYPLNFATSYISSEPENFEIDDYE
jgi:hypothetical protein